MANVTSMGARRTASIGATALLGAAIGVLAGLFLGASLASGHAARTTGLGLRDHEIAAVIGAILGAAAGAFTGGALANRRRS